MGASRYLIGCVFVGLLAGCVGGADSDLDAEGMNLGYDTADGPALPVAPAGATCALIQRGTLGAAQDTDIGVGNGPNWAAGGYPFTWTGISPYDHWSLYQFDLSAVPANSNVVLATFSNYVSWNDQGAATVRAHRITTAWNEATATFNNFGGAASWDPTVLGTMNPDGVGYRSIDVTGLAQAWHSGAAANNGILLEEDPVKLHNYFASEVSTVSRRPSLYVCWVEAPPACGNAGSICGDDGACCAGLVCNGGSCGLPPPVCSPPNGVCNASTPCCNGAICNDGVCPSGSSGSGGGPTCADPGGSCNAGTPCCNGSICNDGVCPVVSVCAQVGAMCGSNGACCSGSCFDGMCVATGGTCLDSDQMGCSPSSPCCNGGHCAFDFCFAPEDFVCAVPGAPCGGGCCWGLVCSSNSGDGVCVVP